MDEMETESSQAWHLEFQCYQLGCELSLCCQQDISEVIGDSAIVCRDPAWRWLTDIYFCYLSYNAMIALYMETKANQFNWVFLNCWA